MTGYLNIPNTVENDPAMLSLVIQALIELPDGWSIGITTPSQANNHGNTDDGMGDNEDNGMIPYFFREEDGISTWQHPELQKWRDRVILLRTGSIAGTMVKSNSGGDGAE